MDKTTELRIAALQAQLDRDRAALVDFCRNRGSQYAALDASYTDDEDFLVIDGWRADEDTIDDPSIEIPGETVAYIDTRSGRVVYVNPDARWDQQCQELIQEKVKQIKWSSFEYFGNNHYLIATAIEWDCDDEDDASVLPETVILPESVTEDDAVDYLTDKFGYCIKSLKTVSAVKGW